jgi:hypothetical protein
MACHLVNFVGREREGSNSCTRLFLEWNWAMFFPPDISHLGYRRTLRRTPDALSATPTACSSHRAGVSRAGNREPLAYRRKP